MQTRVPRRLYAVGPFLCSLLLLAAPVRAQFQPRSAASDAPPGETYHVEAAVGFWLPSADISITSGGSGALTGILGTEIDAKTDLGLTDRRFPEFHVELRPARHHKFRFQYIPISYEQTSTLPRDVVFNGQRYPQGFPTASTLDWKAYRFGYEYDFIATDRGYGGFIVDFKYTDVTVTLNSSGLSEFAQAHAPIPTLGGVGRVYVVPSVSITGEVTGFKLPEKAFKDSSGYYLDVDIYGTVNFTRNVGVQAGFRSLDVDYVLKTDAGSFALKGLFFGLVARY
jgi:hypothetical protein